MLKVCGVATFEEAFGIPIGHSLRLVRSVRRSAEGDIWECEHEEHDAEGRLVAIYESWSRGAASPAGRDGGEDGQGGYVKYAPDGRLLCRWSAAPARRSRAA
jgi:hypothetical protein